MTEEKEETNKYDSWEFKELTVADCMADKIPPKEILSSGDTSVNMRWTSIIALINRNSVQTERINTQISLKDIMVLYEKLMSKTFL